MRALPFRRRDDLADWLPARREYAETGGVIVAVAELVEAGVESVLIRALPHGWEVRVRDEGALSRAVGDGGDAA